VYGGVKAFIEDADYAKAAVARAMLTWTEEIQGRFSSVKLEKGVYTKTAAKERTRSVQG
jgi:hypothetical protein